jgi:hypothetical protein
MPLDNPHQAPISDLELLMDARDRICVDVLWVQGRFSDGDRHCLVAALSLACGNHSFRAPNQTERQLARLLANQLPRKMPLWAKIRLVPARQRLMSFNDDPRTSHEDVIALLDRTIGHLASKVAICLTM